MPNIVAAIIDYGLGNLFSVKHACTAVGISAEVTHTKDQILASDIVILPGVGAFGDAMDQLKRLDLVSLLKELPSQGKLLVGICLGMQLFMTESQEFGSHKGLGLIDGQVVRFENPHRSHRPLKVPQVGWNQIRNNGRNWVDSPLKGLPDGEFMYFVHSFYAQPKNSDMVLSLTRYGQLEFCSSLMDRNIFASQFHPERSGHNGLEIYRNIAAMAQRRID